MINFIEKIITTTNKQEDKGFRQKVRQGIGLVIKIVKVL